MQQNQPQTQKEENINALTHLAGSMGFVYLSIMCSSISHLLYTLIFALMFFSSFLYHFGTSRKSLFRTIDQFFIYVVIGATGDCKGNIETHNADIWGKFDGEIKASGTLTIQEQGAASGDIEYQNLQIKLGGQISGDIKKSDKIQPIKKDVINTFIHITKELIYFLPNRTQQKADVGLHQIRITCGDDYVGYPVPEGWHKDGCNYVAIITLNYDNIVGGISRIRKNLIFLRVNIFRIKTLKE